MGASGPCHNQNMTWDDRLRSEYETRRVAEAQRNSVVAADLAQAQAQIVDMSAEAQRQARTALKGFGPAVFRRYAERGSFGVVFADTVRGRRGLLERKTVLFLSNVQVGLLLDVPPYSESPIGTLTVLADGEFVAGARRSGIRDSFIWFEGGHLVNPQSPTFTKQPPVSVEVDRSLTTDEERVLRRGANLSEYRGHPVAYLGRAHGSVGSGTLHALRPEHRRALQSLPFGLWVDDDDRPLVTSSETLADVVEVLERYCPPSA